MLHEIKLRNEKTWLAMFSGTVFGILIVYTPFTNSKNLCLKIAIFQTSMYLNPIYILIPICFGILLLLVSALDYYLRIKRIIMIKLIYRWQKQANISAASNRFIRNKRVNYNLSRLFSNS